MLYLAEGGKINRFSQLFTFKSRFDWEMHQSEVQLIEVSTGLFSPAHAFSSFE